MEYQPVDATDYWSSLPSDIQQEILLRLPIKDLLNVAATNKITTANINNNYIIWRELYNRRARAPSEPDAVTNYSDSEWKTRYRDMFGWSHPWNCNVCNGSPIECYAFKCLHCEGFTCCQTCYEKHGHFENHVLLKYYSHASGQTAINHKLDDQRGHALVEPECFKCHKELQYPVRRSATDERIYLCDTCVTSAEFSQHRTHRVKCREVCLPTHVNKAVFCCLECTHLHTVEPDSPAWPYQCVTCRTTLIQEGTICVDCHSNSEKMAEHQDHKIIRLPAVRNHTGHCACCRHNARFVCYKCAVCSNEEYCEYCEELGGYHYDGQHPSLVIPHPCLYDQIIAEHSQ